MFIDFTLNGEILKNVSFNGSKLFSNYTGKEIIGDIRFNVPSLEMEDIHLSELTLVSYTEDGLKLTDAFISFEKGSILSFDRDRSPITIVSLFATIIEKEIEYCMDCQGASINNDETCLTCGGDGSLW
jgi:hypothetical protein